MTKFFSWIEAKRYWRIGLPIFIAQLSQTGMTFADTAMTGQYNAEDMAAVALAGSVFAPVALFGIGCLLAFPPLSAQFVGAGEPRKAAHLLRQGIWLTICLCAPLMLFFHAISWRLELFGLAPQTAALSGGYLRALYWGLPAFMFFVNQRSFFEGFSRTRPAMIIGVLGLALNVPCNYILIYGKFGLPALGAAGCGIASSLCYWFMALAMMCFLRADPQFKKLRPLFTPFRKNRPKDEPVFDFRLIWRALKIGFPSAMALFFEVSLFALSAILLAPLGVVTVAGNQIAMNYGALVFMFPLAIGMTATIRVGYCCGAKKLDLARVSALTALCLSVFFAALICASTILFRHGIASIYNNDPAVLDLAMRLMFFIGAYQFADAMQMTGIGVLRGYNDTRIISYICFISYWIIGFPLGYALARTNLIFSRPLGAEGFWIAYIFAMAFGASCYWLRVRHLHSLPPETLLARVRG